MSTHETKPPVGEFSGFLKDIINGKNLGLGGAVVWLLTLTVGVTAAIYGLRFFPPGNYPRLVLALPGLAAGALVFVIACRILHRQRGGQAPD